MNEVKAKKCCGESPIYSSHDDFVNHTKTYKLRCAKCGRKVEVERVIGRISPKKAILIMYSAWNSEVNDE